ncbi:vitamin B6 photo-protection and homoeostasis-domain-containing protein [Aspergillus ambiguus]|uniref:RUS1 family protein n=1 Tax=Aspergillus ambiguus TaxID=176160 RepID=UPI003CCD46DA
MAKRITFAEVDEVNHPTATYIYSEEPGRIDVTHSHSPSWSLRSLKALLVEVFLPAGYPHSVTDDYTAYQIFDSLQAFCSSIAGLLSSRAVLQGVGVGNATASPTSALLLHILQDTSGRLATILFAHRAGTALEPDSKTYRFAADIFNDAAMLLDCLSPGVPAGVPRVTVLSAAGTLRALCGVAGGSAKASLSAHFARGAGAGGSNLAEVNAKDSAQETVISLLGMLVGSLVVSCVSAPRATWLALLGLLAVHLRLNYAAVRAVQLSSLNRHRATLVFSALLAADPAVRDCCVRPCGPDGEELRLSPPSPSSTAPAPAGGPLALTPREIARRERIFAPGDRLFWTDGTELGRCRIGVSLAEVGLGRTRVPLGRLATLFRDEAYMLFGGGEPGSWTVVLKTGCTARARLKAWMQALLVAWVLSVAGEKKNEGDRVLDVVAATLAFLNEHARMDRYLEALERAGWDVDVAALETRPGRRITWEL